MMVYGTEKEVVIRSKAPWLSADQHRPLLFSFINVQGIKLEGFTSHTRRADDGNRLAGLGSWRDEGKDYRSLESYFSNLSSAYDKNLLNLCLTPSQRLSALPSFIRLVYVRSFPALHLSYAPFVFVAAFYVFSVSIRSF